MLAILQNQYFVGIDVGKKTGYLCVMDEKGNLLHHFKCQVTKEALSKLAEFIPQNSIIAIENSTNSFPIYNLFSKLNHKVVISDPFATKAIASAKLKTDKVDAKTLANLLRCDYLPTVWVPDQLSYQTRLLCSHYVSLKRGITRFKNKIQSILARNLINHEFSDLFCKKGIAWLKELQFPDYEKLQLESSLRMVENLEREIENIETEIAKLAYNRSEIDLLLTIPGIDYISATTILSAIGEIKRFSRSKKLVGYFGLCPKIYQSGERMYYGRITKKGRSQVRWIMIQCANAAIRTDKGLKEFYERIREKKGHKVAIVAVASKMLRIIWAMLSGNEKYREGKNKLTERKKAKLRIKARGIKKGGR